MKYLFICTFSNNKLTNQIKYKKNHHGFKLRGGEEGEEGHRHNPGETLSYQKDVSIELVQSVGGIGDGGVW